MRANFRSLASYNYRLWAIGSLVSHIGTWMQRIAQTWLVLTDLTDNNATAVGIVTALQFGPLLLLLPLTGYAADRFDRRKLLFVTQSIMGGLALALGLLTIWGLVQLWHVCVFAFLLGCVSAFDGPAGQTFASELVGEKDLSNAVALNSTTFNLARLIGPAIAGTLITFAGAGTVFLLNAASFATVIGALCLLRVHELQRSAARQPAGGFADGIHYVWQRRDLRAALLMLFMVGAFGLNFPLFISVMCAKEFHVGASGFGFLMSLLAIGSTAGTVVAAGPSRPGMRTLAAAAAAVAAAFILAAAAPTYLLFGLALILVGAAAITLTTSTSSFVQVGSEPSVRGRVVALRNAVALGGTPVGAPLLGWIADTHGARWVLFAAAASGVAATFVALFYWRGRRMMGRMA